MVEQIRHTYLLILQSKKKKIIVKVSLNFDKYYEEIHSQI